MNANTKAVASIQDSEMKKVLAVIAAHTGVFRKDFGPWVAENFQVWVAFVKESQRVQKRGRSRYSARTIIEVIRHERATSETVRAPFKINNSFVPDLGRLYGVIHPGEADFFECRTMSGANTRYQIRTPMPENENAEVPVSA